MGEGGVSLAKINLGLHLSIHQLGFQVNSYCFLPATGN